MNEGSTWRLVSDYIGAGDFLLSANRAYVGTPYGVQCLPYSHDSLRDWKTDLGARTISVQPHGERHILATTLGGAFLLTREGDVDEELLSVEEYVHPAMPIVPGGGKGDSAGGPENCGGNLLVATKTTLQRRSKWRSLDWEFDFKEVLGQSVSSVRLVNLFQMNSHFVAGVVDYDSGIGKVVVLTESGSVAWASDAGPISELFPAGEAVFVWCQTSYGNFETRMTRVDGRDIWRNEDMAGVGRVLSDGSLALIVGSNESPKWDNWEFRRVAANGKIEQTLEGRGRSPVRPLQREDGTLLFIGAAFHLDPSSSRVDYTNFLQLPQLSLFQHLVGVREQLPEFEVYVHKLAPGGSTLDLVYHGSGSYSLAEPFSLGKHVVFCDGKDIIGIET
jgi:hypothetical protein